MGMCHAKDRNVCAGEGNIAAGLGDVMVLVLNDEWCACNGVFVL